MKQKVKFLDLTQALRNALIQLRTDLFLLRGQDVTKEAMESILIQKNSYTRKNWRFRRYKYMKLIDKQRQELGLSPVYFQSVDNLGWLNYFSTI